MAPRMKTFSLVLALLLAASLPVHAQVYRCVDATGKRSYSDKPGPGCVADRKIAAPRPPAAEKSAAGQTRGKDGKLIARKSEPKPPPETAAQLEGRCTGMRQQRDWLASPRGENAPGRDAQIAQIDKALRDCP